jgi:hypothetical protein
VPADVERLFRDLYIGEPRKGVGLPVDVNVLSSKEEELPFFIRLSTGVASVKIWR